MFTYDDLDRLTGQTNASAPGGAHTYRYDTAGNMTVRDSVNYTYPGVNPLVHAVTSLSGAASASYQYDANGNMTNRNGQILTYNYDNQLTGVAPAVGAPASFSAGYGPDGSRAWKFENGVFTQYFNRYFEKEGGVAVKYYYVNGMRIAEDRGGVKRWYHADHLGSTMNISDAAGAMSRWIGYQPFGPDGYDTGTGTNYKYTGKEKDGTGLYYYGARYYDPVLCRFITADARYDSGPQGLNRYSYVLNNPLKYNDPTGAWATQVIGGAVAAAGFGLQVGANYFENWEWIGPAWATGMSTVGGYMVEGGVTFATFSPLAGTAAGVAASILADYITGDLTYESAIVDVAKAGLDFVPNKAAEHAAKVAVELAGNMLFPDELGDEWSNTLPPAPPAQPGPLPLTPAQVLSGGAPLPGFWERHLLPPSYHPIPNWDFSGARGSNGFQDRVRSNSSFYSTDIYDDIFDGRFGSYYQWDMYGTTIWYREYVNGYLYQYFDVFDAQGGYIGGGGLLPPNYYDMRPWLPTTGGGPLP